MAKHINMHSLSAAVERIAHLLRAQVPQEIKKNHKAEVVTASNKIQQIARILRRKSYKGE